MQALDSSVLIEILKGNSNLNSFRKDAIFCTTAINLFEIQAGLFNHEKELLEDLKKHFYIIPFDVDSSNIATNIHKQLLKKGKDIGRFDCMIAGCLIAHNVHSIITHNVKHFRLIKELEVIGVKS